jgi:hypothetical protein
MRRGAATKRRAATHCSTLAAAGAQKLQAAAVAVCKECVHCTENQKLLTQNKA